MIQKVFEIVARMMGVPADAVNIESSPETLANWDSLRHIKLLLSVEESFGIRFSDDDLVSIKNVRDLLARIEARK